MIKSKIKHLEDYVDKYLINNEKVNLDFMTNCLNSRELGRKKIPATLHPQDHTARVQSVSKKHAKGYYDLISSFHKKGGAAAVLNTSLNIHGKPIVRNPIDIAEELLSQEWVKIDGLLLNDRFFKKK